MAKQLFIAGAGLSGLLAANMLRHRSPLIFEKEGELPNNHTAVLRFKSSTFGDVLGIQFKPVTLIKAIKPWSNPVADALAYARKTNGEYRSDRSINRSQVQGETRYIAPDDLILRMAKGLRIEYDTPMTQSNRDCIVISTMPMPQLMKVLCYPEERTIQFKYVEGTNIRAMVRHCDAYASIAVPDPSLPFYRVSLTGNELIIEGSNLLTENDIYYAATLMGIDTTDVFVESIAVHRQQYQKIAPIDDDTRRRFLAWATDQHNVFSLGRYATWRPGLLLDDLVQDVRKIDRWIDDRYALAQVR
jgi:hypothetical protein